MNNINHTQIANEFLDKYLSILNGASVKVFLAVCRKTIGWHKDTDSISVSQLIEMTGLSNRQIINSINELSELKLIMVDKVQGKSSSFTLNYTGEKITPVKKVHRSPVKKVHTTSEKSSQVSPKTSEKSSHTKEIIKETIQKKDEATPPAPINHDNVLRQELIDIFCSGYEFLTGIKLHMDPKEIGQVGLILNRYKKDPDGVKAKIKLYGRLIKSGDKWWSSKPFIPSMFNSLYNNIVEQKNPEAGKFDTTGLKRRWR